MKDKKTIPTVDVRCPACAVLADNPCEAELITGALWIASCKNCGGMYALSFETEVDNTKLYGMHAVWRTRMFT